MHKNFNFALSCAKTERNYQNPLIFLLTSQIIVVQKEKIKFYKQFLLPLQDFCITIIFYKTGISYSGHGLIFLDKNKK